jgi:glycosyltransferase involved in cell wall biosynthesis
VLSTNGRWLFAGRISPEKGLVELLQRWPAGVLMDVVGEGADRQRAEALGIAGVTFHGSLPRDELRRRMAQYDGVVFPSLWYEAGPTQVYVEALAAGVPVLAIEGNGTADDIARYDLGVVLRRGSTATDVTHGIESIRRRRTELSARCLASYAERFTVDRWLESTEKLYMSVVADGEADR